jgi:hypothetical protein
MQFRDPPRTPLSHTGHPPASLTIKQTHNLQFFNSQCKPQAAPEKGARLRLHLKQNEKEKKEHAKKDKWSNGAFWAGPCHRLLSTPEAETSIGKGRYGKGKGV